MAGRYLLHRTQQVARHLPLLAAAVVAAIACRADEGLVGPVVLRVAPTDSVLDPDYPLRLQGVDLEGVQVKVGGLPAHMLESTPTHLRLAVPEALFRPCLRQGVRYEIEVTRGRQRTTFSLPALPVPFRLVLQPGEHAIATAAVARGCAVELPDSGLYLAMPFTWDRDPGRVGGDTASVAARLTILPVSGRLRAARALQQEEDLPRRPARAHPSAGESASREALQWLAATPEFALPASSGAITQTSACPFPSFLGDSVQVATDRTRGGVFVGLHGTDRIDEYWRVVGVSRHLVVLFDQATLQRARRNSAQVRQRLLAFLSQYDSLVAPFFERLLPGREPRQLIPVLMSDTSGTRARGFAYPGWKVASACSRHRVTTNLIWLDGAALFRPSAVQQARLLSTAAHETAHLEDFGFQVPGERRQAWEGWTVEGYADLLRHLWTDQALPHPLTANLKQAPGIRTGGGTIVRSRCGLAMDRARLQEISTSVDYPMACQMVAALVARAVEAGQPLDSVLARFSRLPERRTFTQISNALRGTSDPPSTVVGDWLLSWYADELPGASADIQDPMWNLRSFFPASLLADVTVSPAGAISTMHLNDLDARYIQIPARGAVSVAYTGAGGTPLTIERTDLALLRVR